MGKQRIGKTHTEVKAQLLQDPEVRQAYEALEIAEEIIRLRIECGLTQAELASLTGIAQPNIARLESGRARPSYSTLERIAHALGARLEFRFVRPEGASCPAPPKAAP